MKLIIADLDGTLISKQQMSDSTKQTVQKLKEQGYLFTLATGRHKDATRRVAGELKVDLPVICTNGAFIYDFKTEKVIHQDTIDAISVKKVLDILNEQKSSYLLYTTKSIVSNQTSKDKLAGRIGSFESLVVSEEKLLDYLPLGLLKILIIENDDIKFKQLRDKLSTLESVYVLSSQPSFIDVGNKVANKGRALEILSTYLGITLEEVLSIGDQENDLTMIQKAGIGVSMGDGEQALKEAADFITKPFIEDGFTYAINKFIFKE